MSQNTIGMANYLRRVFPGFLRKLEVRRALPGGHVDCVASYRNVFMSISSPSFCLCGSFEMAAAVRRARGSERGGLHRKAPLPG